MKKSVLLKKRNLAFAIIGITVIGAGIGGFFIFKSKNRVHAQVIPASQTAQANRGNISTTVIGTGILESDSASDIKIPTGITIDEVLVESGSKVSKGDVLATVDAASLTKAINEVQDEITSLDERISECQNSTDTEILTASVSGRVKNIYASADTAAADILAEYGSLISLSLDGKMAVDLKTTSSLSQGDTVTVTDSEGNTYTGTVSSIGNSCTTITVTDNGTKPGEKVSISDNSGTSLGSGTLYIHSQLDITASSGVVSSVCVSENQTVCEGDSLLELTGVSASSEYEELLATRSNLATKLQTLASLSKTNEIVSEYSGTIQSVNISEGNETGITSSGSTSASSGTSSGTSSGQAAAMSYSSSKIKVANMAYKTVSSNTAEDAEATAPVQEFSEETADSDDTYSANSEEAAEAKSGPTSITACSPNIDYPEAGKIPQKDIPETTEYSGTISWNTDDQTFQEGKSYSAVLKLTAKEGYYFTQNVSIDYRFAAVNCLTVGSEPEGNTITFQLTFPALDNTGSEQNSSTQSAQSGNTQNISGSGSTDSSSENTASGSGNASSSSNTAVSAENTADTESSESAKTDSTETSDINTQLTTAFTISSNDNMILSVDIDELDILSVELDQKAAITFDALEDQEFEGTVTKISNTATTSSGGVSKYSVDIRIPSDENMRLGMNASATITTDEKADVLLIPVDALQERGNQVFVYTKQESESGQLAGEVQVETGLSDGSQVEIISGLEEGQAVYYTIAEDTDSSDENMDQMMPDGMGDRMGGPGGGNAPGGDNPRGGQ